MFAENSLNVGGQGLHTWEEDGCIGMHILQRVGKGGPRADICSIYVYGGMFPSILDLSPGALSLHLAVAVQELWFIMCAWCTYGEHGQQVFSCVKCFPIYSVCVCVYVC